jgi:DNA-binding transcriptional regulator YiaG
MSRQGVAQKADMDAAMTADDMKAWRQTMGLSQRAAAAVLGVSSGAVEHWERGLYRIDRRTALACAALHAGLTPWGTGNRMPDN